MSHPVRRSTAVAVGACFFAAAAPAAAQVYVGQSAGGAIVLSDFRSAEAPGVLIDAPRAGTCTNAAAPAADIKAILHEVAANEQVSFLNRLFIRGGRNGGCRSPTFVPRSSG